MIEAVISRSFPDRSVTQLKAEAMTVIEPRSIEYLLVRRYHLSFFD
jgi:hypothetical protein